MMSVLLITLDIVFMVSSLFALLASVCVLSTQLRKIHRQQKDAAIALSKVVPTTGRARKKRMSSYEKADVLRETRKQFGASSKEYQAAVQNAHATPSTGGNESDEQKQASIG